MGGSLERDSRSTHSEPRGMERAEAHLVGGRVVWDHGWSQTRQPCKQKQVVHGPWEGRRKMVASRILPRSNIKDRSRSAPVRGTWEERPRMVGGRILSPRTREYRDFMASHPYVRCNAEM